MRKFKLYKPDFKFIFKTIGYAGIILINNIFCTIGSVIVSIMTNKNFGNNESFISCLGNILPITNVLSTLLSVTMAFIPQNYNVGEKQRVKKALRILMIVAFLYAIFIFVIFAAVGRPYMKMLYPSDSEYDLAAIDWGVKHLFWLGLGYIPCSFIFILRTFLEAVGYGKLSLLSGVMQCTGNLIACFVLMPKIGEMGRILSDPLGWVLAGLTCIILYFALRKRIYAKCDKNKQEFADKGKVF